MLQYSEELIRKQFPFPKPRDGQLEAIHWILDSFSSGKKFVMLEAPVGSGKSVLGMTVAKFFESSFYLTIQKILQTQIVRDFASGTEIVDLMGRQTYHCNYYDRFGETLVKGRALSPVALQNFLDNPPNCSNGYCRRRGKFKSPMCFLAGGDDSYGKLDSLPPGMLYSACPYYERVEQAVRSRVAVMNFSSFLCQTCFSRRFDTRELMILDECLSYGTPILTDKGQLPIGKIVGDNIGCLVACYGNGVVEYRRILRKIDRGYADTYRLAVGDLICYPTADHKFYTPDGLRRVRNLQVGDLVSVLTPGGCVVAAPITVLEKHMHERVYDLEVEEHHNYFAGNMLVSNCHNIESQLMSFISLTVSDARLRHANIIIPQFELPEEYFLWFQDNHILEKVGQIAADARERGDVVVQDEYTELIYKIGRFMRGIEESDEWIAEYKSHQGTNSVTLRPVFVKTDARDLLFKYGINVLMMSATILDVNVFCSALGIAKQQTASKRLSNRFPVENRPIYFRSAGKIVGGRKKMSQWADPLVAKVDEVVAEHPNDRGIIHTHNFDITNLIYERSKHTGRMLFQKDFKNDKNAMLRAHARCKNSILVAPALHEGLDLVGDLSRFQILCKVPWPNFIDDKQLARRVELDERFLLWLTALKTTQCMGRSVRSETDWARSYVLDEVFLSFLERAGSMLPLWFREAVIIPGKASHNLVTVNQT